MHESHHCFYHISLVISEGFYSVENIDDVLLLDHLIDAADGTERSRTSSTGPVKKRERIITTTAHLRYGRSRRWRRQRRTWLLWFSFVLMALDFEYCQHCHNDKFFRSVLVLKFHPYRFVGPCVQENQESLNNLQPKSFYCRWLPVLLITKLTTLDFPVNWDNSSLNKFFTHAKCLKLKCVWN